MRQITDKRRQSYEGKIAQWSEKVFHVVAKDEQEIHVPEEMNDAGMEKERSDKRQAVEAHCVCWNQSKLRDDFVESVKPKALVAVIVATSSQMVHGR